MKALFQINVVANTGSTGRIAEEIGQTVQNAGWKSYIAYGRYGNPSSSELIKIGNKWNVLNHVIQNRLFDNHGLASKSATRDLIKKIDEIRPDIIHLHNIHGYYLNYPILFHYLANAGIPVVWTLHDCWPFTGHCAYFESIKCSLWKKHCHDCLLKNVYPASFRDASSRNFGLKKKFFFFFFYF